MAGTTAFMTVTGKMSGAIKGDVTQRGHAGAILVEELDYAVRSPRDAASGRATGRRIHEPVTVTVSTGKQTPLIFKAATTNEVLQVKIDIFGLDAKGVQSLACSLALTNAEVAEFRLGLQGAAADAGLVDHYSFAFQKIDLTWAKGGVTASDDWGPAVT